MTANLLLKDIGFKNIVNKIIDYGGLPKEIISCINLFNLKPHHYLQYTKFIHFGGFNEYYTLKEFDGESNQNIFDWFILFELSEKPFNWNNSLSEDSWLILLLLNNTKSKAHQILLDFLFEGNPPINYKDQSFYNFEIDYNTLKLKLFNVFNETIMYKENISIDYINSKPFC